MLADRPDYCQTELNQELPDTVVVSGMSRPCRHAQRAQQICSRPAGDRVAVRTADQCKEVQECRMLHTLPKKPVSHCDMQGRGLHNRRSGTAIPAAEWAADLQR